jgi:hypothetical protein
MFFKELNSESRQRLIDVQQRGEALRVVEIELRRRFLGSMAWKARAGRDYLYRRHGRVEKALGARSSETEAIYEAFTSGKSAAEERERGLRRALESMAAVNRAMGLGRVPKDVARILRRLDQASVLGEQLCVVGTNALFAYEAEAGLRFESGLLATNDLDIALDARRNLRLAARNVPDGLLALLRRADATFAPVASDSFRAVNASGVMVDLITPEPRNPMTARPKHRLRLGATATSMPVPDIQAVEVPRLEMIVDAPRVGKIAVADDGLPVWISAADPRWWAAHKLWLATQANREPVNRHRDHDQGMAVAAMLANHWANADLSDAVLNAIPAELRTALRDAVATAIVQDDMATKW